MRYKVWYGEKDVLLKGPLVMANRAFAFAATYFKMSRKQCKQGLDIYKKFVIRMDGVAKFLRVAEVTNGVWVGRGGGRRIHRVLC